MRRAEKDAARCRRLLRVFHKYPGREKKKKLEIGERGGKKIWEIDRKSREYQARLFFLTKEMRERWEKSQTVTRSPAGRTKEKERTKQKGREGNEKEDIDEQPQKRDAGHVSHGEQRRRTGEGDSCIIKRETDV